MERNKLKMYSLVMYQVKGIHAGIQSWHSSDEFANKYENDPLIYQDYLHWRRHDKVVTVLDAGTSGSFLSAIEQLQLQNIPYADFKEEDNYNHAFALAFLVDERAWPFYNEKYPDLPEYYDYLKKFNFMSKEKNRLIRSGEIAEAAAIREDEKLLKIKAEPVFTAWKEMMGTDQNVFLREFLKGFQLFRG